MKHIEAKQVLEIGTYDGFVALNLAANIANDGLVYTVDLPPTYRDLNGKAEPISNACAGELLGRKFEAVPEARNIRQILCDSTALDWSAMGGPFDLIFIDGCHDRYYVERDTANAFANLSEGGVVLWHDYGQFPDVSSVVDGWACRYPIYALKGTRLAIYSSALDRPCNQVDRETVQLGRTPRGGR